MPSSVLKVDSRAIYGSCTSRLLAVCNEKALMLLIMLENTGALKIQYGTGKRERGTREGHLRKLNCSTSTLLSPCLVHADSSVVCLHTGFGSPHFLYATRYCIRYQSFEKVQSISSATRGKATPTPPTGNRVHSSLVFARGV